MYCLCPDAATRAPHPPDKDVGTSIPTEDTLLSARDSHTASTKTPEKLTRHVRQLFIRGDNVVLIALADPALRIEGESTQHSAATDTTRAIGI